ncbi:hypothetical protein OKW30_001187 [Paraburkholderia sp. Clong3]|uniref:hypothetical protein n=1 Tax=Paraburkholderia sp. Clong3 TaxID=2991061 RepID=UPI003D1DCCD7
MTVKLFEDDNRHYQDPEYRACRGSFETVGAAISEAQRIVNASLDELFEPGMSATELFARYQAFGADPWIPAGDDGPLIAFSAWDFARERCEAICGATQK